MNRVGCEGQIGWRTLILGSVEEEGMVSVWAQHRTLCSTDSFLDLGSIRDDPPKLSSDGILRRSGPRRKEIQGNGAFPPLVRLRQSAVHRAPVQQSSTTENRGGALFEEIVPRACVQGSWEFYPRNGLDDRGLPNALVSKHTDCRDIQISTDARELSVLILKVACDDTHPVECT